jgi:hypothetical protein
MRSQILYQVATSRERLLLVTTAERLALNGLDLSAHPPLYTAGIYRLYALAPRSLSATTSVSRGNRP